MRCTPRASNGPNHLGLCARQIATATADDPFGGTPSSVEGDLYSYGGSGVSVVAILILSQLYAMAATYMNRIENHRTATDATDAVRHATPS